MDILRDIDCTMHTPVVFGHPAEPIYGRGVPLIPRYLSKNVTKTDQRIYLHELIPLEEYDQVILLFSGGKDSTAAFYYLLELGVPREKIELWHHDLNGGHPTRIMDWTVTMAYVDSFAKAEGVRLRVSRRVNGFWGEVYRIGASYPVEYEGDDGTYTQCELSNVQKESDRLRNQIMREVMPNDDFSFENSAELNRAWCARYEELLLQDIVTVEMGQLAKAGNERMYPGMAHAISVENASMNTELLARKYIMRIKHPDCQGSRSCPGCSDAGENILRDISTLKNLQSFHLRLPAIQAIERGRYCTSVGKSKVLNRAVVAMTGPTPVKILVVSGERRGESKNRAGYNEIELHPTNATIRGNRLVHWWRPVIDHSEKDVWVRIKRHRCVPHPVYACGWNRCSCMMCIFSKREQWAGIRELFPGEFNRLIKDERILGYNMHIGVPLEEHIGDAVSCVCYDNPTAIRQLVDGIFTPEEIHTNEWVYPAGAFRGSEGGPC